MNSVSDRTDFSATSTYHTQVEADDFTKRVLHYIKAHHPKGDLSILLDTMRKLAPQQNLTLEQLSSALNQANNMLRQDASEAEYVRDELNSRAVELTGLNGFMNTMMADLLFPADESNSKLELW